MYSDTAMVSADVATLDITRHEVAHIVTREATKGPFGIPDWMNEGIIRLLADRARSRATTPRSQAAIRSDNVLSMPELNSSASGRAASTVGLYYGQAGSMVKYLVDTYGDEKFAELLRTFKEGSTPDKAFQTVYGFDQLGLENEWRESVGLDPRTASATPTPRATEEARAPDVAGAADGDGDASSVGRWHITTTIAIIVGLAAAMLAMIAGAALAVCAGCSRRVGADVGFAARAEPAC